MLLIYAGAGHMLPLDRSDEVTDRIAELVNPRPPLTRHPAISN